MFCVSDELLAYARKYRTDSIFKMTNGVEEWAFTIPYSPGKKHSLVYVTNYGKWSQVMPLIQVVSDLRTTIPDISLTLIGDGPEIPAAKHYVEEQQSRGSRRHSRVRSATEGSSSGSGEQARSVSQHLGEEPLPDRPVP